MEPSTAMPNYKAIDAGRLVDHDWYLLKYPDVAISSSDPVDHYFGNGHKEGRDPNPFFSTRWYREQYLNNSFDVNPLQHYVEFDYIEAIVSVPFIDKAFLRKQFNLQSEGGVLQFLIDNKDQVDFLSPWFSMKKFLQANSDTLEYSGSIFTHFICHGVYESRELGGDIFVIRSREPRIERYRRGLYRNLAQLQINQEMFEIWQRRIDEGIYAQIREQAEIEPDVVAPGILSVPYLPKFDGADIDTRNVIDSNGLFGSFPDDVQAVILLSSLGIGGAEKYVANLAGMLSKSGLRCVVATTNSWREDDANALTYEILKDMKLVTTSSLFPFLQGSWAPELNLALVLSCFEPKYIFVVNSEIGYKMISKYGRALKNRSKLFCAFFSESPFAMGAPYSARYLRKVAEHSTILSDNVAALQLFKRRLGLSEDGKFVCLPSFVMPISERDFRARVEFRANLANQVKIIRCLWTGRWEPFKATGIVKAIAEMFKGRIQIDVFGPQENGESQAVPGINFRGPYKNFHEIPLQDYDIYLFTSYFEGMPNSVLEMAGSGILVVASDVGGLRETFDDSSVALVSMRGNEDDVARRFCDEIVRLSSLTKEEIRNRLWAARNSLIARHSSVHYSANISKLLEE